MALRISLALLGITLMASAQTDEYVVKWTQTPPTVDGRLGDPCWRKASPGPPLYTTGGANETAKNPTSVQMLMDNEALYVLVDAATAPGKAPAAVQRPHDGKTWNDDSIELFVLDAFTHQDYCHLTFNALGSRMDAKHVSDLQPDQYTTWNPEWQVVTAPREGGWSAEAVVPWEAFGRKSAPPAGWVWRTKIGCMAQGYQNSMWPRNDSNGFHNPACWGYLVFRDSNLADNPGLEDGIPQTGAPRGWLYAYHATEGKGECRVTGEAAASGKYAARLEKLDDNQWFPVLYVDRLPVQAGSTYELSAMVNCDREYRMRYTLIGPGGGKQSAAMPPTDGWRRVRLEATVPDTGVEQLMLGWQLIQQKGVILVDDVVIRRINSVVGTVQSQPTPHPFHNLEALAARTAFKPYSLLQRPDGSCQSDRVIFRDSGTGAETWMLTRSGGTSSRHYYMEITPWNSDGSLVSLHSGQLGKGTLLMPADASSYRKLPFYASGAVWDRGDRTRLWFRKYRGHDVTDLWDLAWGNVLTGEVQVTRRFEGDVSLWPMSQDAKRLLVQETLVDENGKRYSRLWVMNSDGTDGLMLTPEGLVHQTWFTKLGDYSIEFEWEGQRPRGQYMITTDNVVHKICDTTYGHRAHSPNGQWIAGMGSCHVRNIKTNELRVIAPESSNHQTWETCNDWYCTSGGRYLKRVVAFGSPTVQRLGAHNSGLKHSTYWSEAHPEMSHDGTKLGFASSMLGDIEFYSLVMGKPWQPTLRRATQGATDITLAWRSGEPSKELRGYLVYLSAQSGRPGTQVTAEPVQGLEFAVSREMIYGRDSGDPRDGLFFARVTAVDHSGLESLPSNELALISDIPLHRNLYFEAETGAYEPPAAEVFDPSAGGLYGVSLGQLRTAGSLRINAACPYYTPMKHLWIRARSAKAVTLSAKSSAVDLGQAQVTSDQWTWLRTNRTAGPGDLVETVQLQASAPGVVVDRICVANDPGYVPTGIGGLDEAAPGPVRDVQATAAGHYAVRLRWQAPQEQDVSHYNVYAANEAGFEPTQEHLIASPSATEYVDWGLKAGTAYYYRVTAVDRARNESAPALPVAATTDTLTHRLFLQVNEDWNSTQRPSMEISFAMPADGHFTVWGKVQSLDGRRSAPIELSLDGKTLASVGVSFDYICVGHGGPVLDTWLWDCLRPALGSPDDPMGFPAKAGRHVLTLAAPQQTKTLWESFVITNDLGFEPEGTVDFLVRPTSD